MYLSLRIRIPPPYHWIIQPALDALLLQTHCIALIIWCVGPIIWCVCPIIWCVAPILWCVAPILRCFIVWSWLAHTDSASQPTSKLVASILEIPWLLSSEVGARGEQGGGGGEGWEEGKEKDDFGKVSCRGQATWIHGESRRCGEERKGQAKCLLDSRRESVKKCPRSGGKGGLHVNVWQRQSCVHLNMLIQQWGVLSQIFCVDWGITWTMSQPMWEWFTILDTVTLNDCQFGFKIKLCSCNNCKSTNCTAARSALQMQKLSQCKINSFLFSACSCEIKHRLKRLKWLYTVAGKCR